MIVLEYLEKGIPALGKHSGGCVVAVLEGFYVDTCTSVSTFIYLYTCIYM